MGVVDLGRGAGGVAPLGAELVGASGTVVEIDRSREVVVVTMERARTADLRHVEFREVSVEPSSS
jgi:ubiquinone/menaquinone biosynthesis C-methylase UbiE